MRLARSSPTKARRSTHTVRKISSAEQRFSARTEPQTKLRVFFSRVNQREEINGKSSYHIRVRSLFRRNPRFLNLAEQQQVEFRIAWQPSPSPRRNQTAPSASQPHATNRPPLPQTRVIDVLNLSPVSRPDRKETFRE